jgi:formate hydrogenlyase subunit 4
MEVFSLTARNAAQCLLAPAVALIAAPLLPGIINRVKALFAGRKGPPLLQAYYDLFRLLRKDSVYSRSTSWVFRIAPVVVFASTLAATLFIPVASRGSVFNGPADFVIFLYLLGLARFFLILSALDTASAFEGMGASREAFFSAIAEPVAFLCLLNVMRENHTESLGAALSGVPVVTDSISVILSALPLFIVLLAENARIPFDDPNTHLELTMVHEVMILDNSGSGLALFEYAAALKLWLFSLVIANILLPVSGSHPGLQVPILLGIIIIIAMVVGIVESVMARLRLLKVPQLLLGAGVLAMMGFFISVTGALAG